LGLVLCFAVAATKQVDAAVSTTFLAARRNFTNNSFFKCPNIHMPHAAHASALQTLTMKNRGRRGIRSRTCAGSAKYTNNKVPLVRLFFYDVTPCLTPKSGSSVVRELDLWLRSLMYSANNVADRAMKHASNTPRTIVAVVECGLQVVALDATCAAHGGHCGHGARWLSYLFPGVEGAAVSAVAVTADLAARTARTAGFELVAACASWGATSAACAAFIAAIACS
jgi:hypothetical protein